MIKLIQAQVWKYKSIENSTSVEISDAVTALVGKNESGKTAFLESLHKSLPLIKAKFDYVADYPRKDLVRYRPDHLAGKFQEVVHLTFRVGTEVAENINKELFGGVKVITGDTVYTRIVTYGNTTIIRFHIDQDLALKALKKTLEGAEYLEEVFANAETLKHVIAKIKEKELASDSCLELFAKTWEDRTQGLSSTWDHISGYIWQNYLGPATPKFLYFDDYRLLDGKINLPTLQQRQTNNQLTDADETAFGLLDLAGTTLTELMSDEGYETAKAKLEAIGLNITQRIFKFWKQNNDLDVEFDVKADPKDSPPYNSGVNLYIRIKNRRHGVTLPFDQRSKGFIWFFSFLVWFDAIQARVGTEDDLILLLDEPGLNLHALAQADLLAYVRDLSSQHQIIYSTHSPFMVDSERLDEARVVEDRIQEGTTISGDLAGSSDESLFPLQAALGYSIAQNLFISKKNILVEGPADLILLQHLGALMEGMEKQGIGDATLVPVGGLDKLATFVALLGAHRLNIVVLHDCVSAPHQKLEDLIRQKLIEKKRVLDYSMFLENPATEADIEDLLPVHLYIDAFNIAYSNELGGSLLTVADLGSQPRIVARIDQWLKFKNLNLVKGGGYNHYRVAQVMLTKLTPTSINKTEISRYEALFERLKTILKL